MRLDLVSDLHLEFDVKNLILTPNADTLVMAGDIMGVDSLSTEKSLPFSIWLTQMAGLYKNVVWVFGNHEHYGSIITESKKELQLFLDAHKLNNIHLLENETIEIEDAIIFGATMWTSIDNQHPVKMFSIEKAMNDYSYIKRHRVSSSGALKREKLRTIDTVNIHKESLKHFREFAKLKTDKKKIVVSHHAPSFMSICGEFVGHYLNDAYAEDLYSEYFNSGVVLSVHGHIHDPVDYMLGKTLVRSNPRGYYGRSAPSGYDVLTLEV